MILDNRQTKFGAVRVPEIERCPTEIKFSKGYNSIKNALVEALIDKFHNEMEIMIEDSVSQSLNFLVIMGATKEDLREDIIRSLEGKVTLWKEFIQLSPLYEGVAIALKTMLIKHHYPNMYKRMSDESLPMEKRIYSHWGLTVIKECVLYTMEYLQKNELLINELDLIKRDNFKGWINDI